MKTHISDYLANVSTAKTKPNRGILMLMCTCLLTVAGQVVVPLFLRSQSAEGRANQSPLMERQKEITMALSACPPALVSKASVYVSMRLAT
jgi:hypothetical protein